MHKWLSDEEITTVESMKMNIFGKISISYSEQKIEIKQNGYTNTHYSMLFLSIKQRNILKKNICDTEENAFYRK